MNRAVLGVVLCFGLIVGAASGGTSTDPKKYKADMILSKHMKIIVADSGNSKKILENLNVIFKECKLPVDQDTALHLALVPILRGAKALDKDPADTKAKEQIQNGIAEYQRRFED